MLREWDETLRPGATGYLGTTGGVTDDGQLVALARFESREAATANATRPEQDDWWKRFEACIDGPVAFADCDEVDVLLRGGSNDAGFVQVQQGRVHDVAAVRALATEAEPALAEWRPDLIGGIVAFHGDGGYTEADYFTSEAEARAGEAREPTPAMRELLGRWKPLFADVTYFDLRRPWLR
jgi:hypothetical protein